MKYSVEITGPALSFLYYATSSKARKGFLLGKIEEQHVDVISDTNECDVRQETLIRISGVIPSTDACQPFYSANISLNEDVLKSITSKQVDTSVIGWFCCRRNSKFKPSFCETALHDKLSRRFCKSNMNNFVFVLVQDTLTKPNSIQGIQSLFYQLKNERWQPLVGSVLNWRQKSNSNSSKDTYRTLPTHEASLLKTFSQDPQCLGLVGEELMEGIFKVAHGYLTESVERISNLQSEILQLEHKIARLQFDRSNREQDDEVNMDEDDILGEECFSDESPSPPIMARRKHGTN